MPTKICTTDGCDKPFKAKGLCGTHYNQQLPNRHRKVTVPCDCCGEPTQKEARARRYEGSYCSERCRDVARKQATALSHSQVEAHKPVPLWHTAHRAYKAPKQSARVFLSGTCIVCGDSFLSLYGDKACGNECQDTHRRAVTREHKHRRRARQRSAYVAPVYRLRIYERDNFTCQLCLEPMSMDTRAPHPQSPTIDHVVALARGGTHEPANVQAAHFICNSTKGHRDQLTAV